MVEIEISNPGTTYRGTRFDWTGVFRRVVFDGIEYAGIWYDGDDPFRHDNLCGMSEEFGALWLPDGRCLKIGVGVLDVPDDVQYDRFRLYDILDGGEFTVNENQWGRSTRHLMPGIYDYTKTIRVTGDNSFIIAHHFENTGSAPLATDCYNHNFITFGKQIVGPGRTLEFPGELSGNWRPDSSPKAVRNGRTIQFVGIMQPGEKSFIGDLRCVAPSTMPDSGYTFSVCDGRMCVDVRCDVPMDHAVFWTNHRVACVEPYVQINLGPGMSFDWTISYSLR